MKQAKLTFMHAVNYNYAPKSFNSTWVKNNNLDRNFNLRNDDDFKLPSPKTDLFKKMPIYCLPVEWNNSGILKFYTNNHTFKIALREQLFSEIEIETQN